MIPLRTGEVFFTPPPPTPQPRSIKKVSRRKIKGIFFSYGFFFLEYEYIAVTWHNKFSQTNDNSRKLQPVQ